MEKKDKIVPLQAFFEERYAEVGGDALKQIRAKAWDHFLELGLPEQSDEVFRYIKRRELYARGFQPAVAGKLSKDWEDLILPECQQSVFVFVNGFFRADLTRAKALDAKVIHAPLEDAVATYGAFLKNRWARTLKEETDAFAIANVALADHGLFLYVPAKTIVDVPVQILNLTDTKDRPAFMMPRFQAFVGAQSEIQVSHTAHHLSGEGYGINQVFDWTLDDAARVEFASACFNEPSDVWRLEALRAQLKRDSYFRAISVTAGTATHRNDYRVAMNGENADARLKGLCILGGSHQAHSNILIDHRAPNCSSMQLFKALIDDSAKSSFEGKIYVHKEAQLTDAFQLNKNLLLGPHAQAYSKPNLEIFADDVKASHGATVGQLDKDELFYLETRGVPARQARNMLVRGFIDEVIEKIPLGSLRERVLDWARTQVQ